VILKYEDSKSLKFREDLVKTKGAEEYRRAAKGKRLFRRPCLTNGFGIAHQQRQLHAHRPVGD